MARTKQTINHHPVAMKAPKKQTPAKNAMVVIPDLPSESDEEMESDQSNTLTDKDEVDEAEVSPKPKPIKPVKLDAKCLEINDFFDQMLLGSGQTINVGDLREDNLRRLNLVSLDAETIVPEKIPAVNHYPPITEFIYKWHRDLIGAEDPRAEVI